ncbi:uncharacterized protein METZ01_LOCUS463414 [marine metagenome]|uniref:Uncharacterized protein n=1 Tax=marine metagenome TaxID=408172 RepID=A0A383ASQ1_9ZZZZ
MKAPFDFNEFLMLLVLVVFFGAIGYALYAFILAISYLIN